MDESEEKEQHLTAYRKGREDGEHLAKREIATELVNIYDSTNGWFDRLWRRNAKLTAYIDDLWDKFGPEEDDGEDDE